MAGSLRLFEYESDIGTLFSVKLDESNSEAVVQGESFLDDRTATHPFLPPGHKMRYILCYDSAAPARRRKFYVGSIAKAQQILTVSTFQAPPYPNSADSTWVMTAYRGEQAAIPASHDSSTDTGLNDGDSVNP